MTQPYWHQVIAEAREREKRGLKPFFKRNIYEASQWPTCACGKIDPRIPRLVISAAPKDQRLRELGNDFSGCVRYGFVNEAERALAAIDARERELIAEIEGRT